MAADYLVRRRPRAHGCRFDVVAVTFDECGRPSIEVIANAFEAA